MNRDRFDNPCEPQFKPCNRNCYYVVSITGPTGPTGPAGSGTGATVTVGTTTTGLPGTDASVVNSGTAQDVILDFSIPQGPTGPQGLQGIPGEIGPTGPAGVDTTVTVGTTTTGDPGTDAFVVNSGTADNLILDFTIPAGPTGPTGPAAIALSYADFYALMPGDNPATIAPGGAVSFPQDGPNDGTSITRASGTTFTLADTGTYEVYFDVPVTEAGQLQITVNGTPIDYTITGRATGTSNISGIFLITTTAANSIVSVINAVGNTTALTITPNAGGTEPVSAHLTIKQIA